MKVLVILVGLLLILGGIVFFSIDKPVVNNKCVNLPSPNVDTTKPLSEIIIDFEQDPKFNGYELKDYKRCE